MHKQPFLIFLICLISHSVFAQKKEVTGIVIKAKKGNPLGNVTVILMEEGENAVKDFTYTTAEGTFSLKIPADDSNNVLKFSLMGYASKTISLLNQSNNIKVGLEEEPINIKEVAIKAPKIRQHGDTISYMVSSFAGIEDKTIGDVLNKMPGIEVEKSGSIKYNGIPINKFYIEGLDLLEGKYGIATNGIPQKEVSQIEILENHQPIKALEDFTFSENAAINLKLKDASKSKWIGTANLGSGFSPLLWDAELMGMRFSTMSQSLNTYKTNNTGKDIIGETQSFNLEDMLSSDNRYSPADYINIAPSSVPGVDKKRLRFNETHTVTTSNLWKLGNDYELKGQIVYSNDQLENNNLIRTNYFTSQDTLTIDELETAGIQKNKLSLGAILTANTKKIYLKNKVSSDLKWNSIKSSIKGTYPSEQLGDLPEGSIVNDFELIKRTDKKLISISSYNMFFSKKQSLKVFKDEMNASQNIHNSGFFSNTSLGYNLHFSSISISLEGGISILNRKLKNQLTGETIPTEILSNPASSYFSYIHPYLKPELEYKSKSLVATLSLPIHYYHYKYDPREEEKKDSYFIAPRFNVHYYTSPKISLYISGTLKDYPLSDQFFYEGVILQNYRSLHQGYTNFDLDKSKSLTVGANYKDPIKMLFANISTLRMRNHIPKISERNFLNDYVVYSFLNQSKNNDSWQVRGRVSKGLSLLNGLFSTSVLYSSAESAIFQEGEYTPFISRNFVLIPGITTRLTKWSTAKYEFSYGRNTFLAEGAETVLKNYQIKHEAEISVTPFKKLRISFFGKYYENQLSEDLIKKLFLMDSGVYYTLTTGLELNVYATNILNEDSYAYTISNDLSSTYSWHEMRPRNIIFSLYLRF